MGEKKTIRSADGRESGSSSGAGARSTLPVKPDQLFAGLPVNRGSTAVHQVRNGALAKAYLRADSLLRHAACKKLGDQGFPVHGESSKGYP